MADRPRALLAMDPVFLHQLFPEPLMRRLAAVLDFDPDLIARDFTEPAAKAALAEAEVIVSSWGAPHLSDEALAGAPSLKAVLHAAGTVKWIIGKSGWERGLAVSSAAGANALPVAEYTLASILMAGKGIFQLREDFRKDRTFTLGYIHPEVGNFGRVIGIIGASKIGRRVVELLRPFDFTVLLADPYVEETEAAALGAALVSLDELVARADVVTVHAPDLAETEHLINAERLALMRDGTVVVNTARGKLVDTDALTAEVLSGRLSAVIDVTHPEPLPAHSPLYDLPNVFLTPHVAGSHGNELSRMGQFMVEDAERYVAGEPLLHRVDHETLWRQA
ncbi:hydroxyacid dehydrogenase [Glycomyces niveus]|uniref:Hydroxyacid dehydrogenase n=1 Tax=Glycomyces niveus TaxID=2820287 RepID=A0ABS3U8M0_9ACTN|nr:hydroxyacid dehydrogenase [Glycomyces sp. NEAU-S30]MBO3735110.1 hydroxyacid dehydrogenase [Glycomyces sp. NEAU-S30]